MPAASPKPLRTIQPNEKVPSMRVGDCGEPVAQLRAALEMIGMEAPVTANNPEFFDDGMRRAVMQFQSKMGLRSSGEFGKREFGFMQAESERLAKAGKLKEPNSIPSVNTASMTQLPVADVAKKLFPGLSSGAAKLLMETDPAQFSNAFDHFTRGQAEAMKFELESWLQKHGKDPMRQKEAQVVAHALTVVSDQLNTRKVVQLRPGAPKAETPPPPSVTTPPAPVTDPDVGMGTTASMPGGAEVVPITGGDGQVDVLDETQPEPSPGRSALAVLGLAVAGLILWGLIAEDAHRGPPKMVA